MTNFSLILPFLLGAIPAIQPQSFSCRINVLTPDERQAMSNSFQILMEAKPQVRETRRGYEMRFARNEKLLVPIATWISGESRCCSFLEFEIRVSGDLGSIIVRVSGPQGAKKFIRAEFPQLLDL